jgi:ATP-dependent RNA helicase DDX49/DBP8
MNQWPTWFDIDKTMELYEVNENEVLDILSEVTAAKRVASMVS